MTESTASMMAHLIGFLTGIVLYAMLMVMVLRSSDGQKGNSGEHGKFLPVRRLSLWTAVLGLLWNAGALTSYALPRVGLEIASPWVYIMALSSLGFLPAVVVHSFLQAGETSLSQWARKAILTAAYAMSSAACVLNLSQISQGLAGPSTQAAQFLAIGFIFLFAFILLSTLKQQGWGQRAILVALSVSLIAALPLSHHESGEFFWLVELIGHHASLPLALAILYQDYRFALADIFLKRALAFIILVGTAVALYLLVAAPFMPSQLGGVWTDPSSVTVILSLWVLTALLYPYLCRLINWFVDTIVLQRPDYENLRQSMANEIGMLESPEAILKKGAELLEPVFLTDHIEWISGPVNEDTATSVRSSSLVEYKKGRVQPYSTNAAEMCLCGLNGQRGPSTDRDHNMPAGVYVRIPTVDHPEYQLVIRELPQGRRLLFDDFALLESVAHLLARRIDAVRVSHERCERAIHEKEVAKLATEAELRALRGQLNPHFLFNALTTIGYLIQAAPHRAVDTLMNLTELLRWVLKRLEGEFATMSQEVDLAQAYLEIEKARFEERLTVQISVPQEVHEILVPALILQPLVENAVKHGIQPSTTGGEVRIVVEIEKDRNGRPGPSYQPATLILQVKNTGVGFRNSRTESKEKSGIGLANIKKRLLLHYGGRASLEIDSESGQNTVVEIRIPVGLKSSSERASRQAVGAGAQKS